MGAEEVISVGWRSFRDGEGLDLINVGEGEEISPRGGSDGRAVRNFVDGDGRDKHWNCMAIRTPKGPDFIGEAVECGTTVMMEVVEDKDLMVRRGPKECNGWVGAGINDTLGLRTTPCAVVQKIFELIHEGILGGVS